MLKAVRGAITVTANTPQAITEGVTTLVTQLLALNPVIEQEAVCAVFFTVTPDLTALSPAKALRAALPWGDVPLLCAQEPTVEGLPGRCIRMMIQVTVPEAGVALTPVYLGDARQLRPDLTQA